MPGEKIIFYTDEDVDGDETRWARNLGVEIVTAVEAGNRTKDDPVHFAYASEHGYVMVTGNHLDYEALFYEYAAKGIDQPGLVLISADIRHRKGLIARELSFLFQTADRDFMRNRIYWMKVKHG